MTYMLEGLPEGIIGQHEVEVRDFEELLAKYPELKELSGQGKISLNGERITGFAACDG